MGIVSAEGGDEVSLTFLSAAVIFSCLDLLWLGVDRDFYNTQLGALKAAPVLVMPAILFTFILDLWSGSQLLRVMVHGRHLSEVRAWVYSPTAPMS